MGRTLFFKFILLLKKLYEHERKVSNCFNVKTIELRTCLLYNILNLIIIPKLYNLRVYYVKGL